MKKFLCMFLGISMISLQALDCSAMNSADSEKNAPSMQTVFTDDLKDFNFENYETDVLNKIKDKISETSEMAFVEQAFLNGLIRKYKPKKILELGVSAGGSSAIILNACKDMPDSKLYSIDKLNYYYRNPEKSAGYIVEEKFPELMDKWKLYKGDIPCSFIDEIGNDIDFVLIDTVHVRPGEIGDFLSVLPYLKKDAIVCFHDVGASFNWGLRFKPAYYCNDILFSCIKGDKFLPKTEYKEFFPNIGAVKLSENQENSLLDYFFLFSLPWEYIPEENDSQKLINHFEKHYSSKLVDYYKKGLAANKKYHDKVSILAQRPQETYKNKTFGLLCYGYNYINKGFDKSPESCNLGDYIQSIAARQFLPKPYDEVLIDRDTLKYYNGPRAKMIMNGWYFLDKNNEVCSDKIDPVFVSVHINNDEEDVSQTTIDYLKKHEPIGCRDYYTQKLLSKRGVNAYFSGCLTTTLDKTYKVDDSERTEDIIFCDYKIGWYKEADEQLKKLKKYDFNNVVYTNHDVSKNLTDKGRFEITDELLKKYARAKLVVTTRIHCALPCLALGTPVILINSHYDKKRFDGLYSLLNTIGINENGNFEFKVNTDNDKVVNSKEYLKYAEKLKSNLNNAIN